MSPRADDTPRRGAQPRRGTSRDLPVEEAEEKRGFSGIGDARAYTPRGRTMAERDQRTRSPRAGRTTDPFRPALQVLDGGRPQRGRRPAEPAGDAPEPPRARRPEPDTDEDRPRRRPEPAPDEGQPRRRPEPDADEDKPRRAGRAGTGDRTSSTRGDRTTASRSGDRTT